MATTFPDDCLPPEGLYESQEALFKSINAWAIIRGYAFVNLRSTKVRGKLRITYACDRSRQPPTSPLRERQRKSTTRMTQCPFSVLAKESVDGTWSLKHRPDQQFSIHNHEPSQHASAHPVHWQLPSSEKRRLKSLSNAGIAPKDIQTLIQQSSSLTTQQDIYNRIADVYWDVCKGQSSIHTLSNQLKKQGF